MNAPDRVPWLLPGVPGGPPDVAPLDRETFAAIAELLYRTIGLSLAPGKLPVVAARLAPRARALGLDDLRAYYVRIADGDEDGEFQVAVDLLTTNETYFFREPAHFAMLERELPRMPRRPLAVWSAACSYGDEPYSVAMVLQDLASTGRIAAGWTVLGTDVSDRALRTAVAAVYPPERLRLLDAERRRRYMAAGDDLAPGELRVAEALRQGVRFGRVNLCEDIEMLGPFDVILLRNVLVYFDAPTRQVVIDRLLGQLRPGGLFVVGTADGRVQSALPLEVLGPGIVRRRAGGAA